MYDSRSLLVSPGGGFLVTELTKMAGERDIGCVAQGSNLKTGKTLKKRKLAHVAALVGEKEPTFKIQPA